MYLTSNNIRVMNLKEYIYSFRPEINNIILKDSINHNLIRIINRNKYGIKIRKKYEN